MNTITTIHAALRGSARRIVSSLALALLAVSASAQTVGFTADTTAEQFGTYQNVNGGLLNIGRQMTVTGAGIEVLQLGVFDYQSDGLAAAHTVTLFDSTATPIASVTVPAGTSAPLINAFRFAPLGTPLFLPAGNYSILAYQMNASDPYGNGNAPGFNGGGNVSPGAGVYHFTSNPSPDYWTDTSGENFASVSFTYTNVPPATGIWTGGGADNKWSTAGNWNGLPIFPSDLTFAGNTRLVNSNDNSGITVSRIIFDVAAGAFTLNGNDITLSGNIGFNGEPATPVTQTINLAMATAGDITVGTSTNGSITLNGNITGGNQLTQAGPDNAGVLTLGGTNSSKGLVVNNGTNRITGVTTVTGIGGSSFFYVPDAGTSRNSTLIIEPGATLTVTGPFQDAAVIARDGGIGKIIQNGGTFNFDINDGSHSYLFVGATGNSNTRAEYDMNGGLLDMNGWTLGVCLSGASSVTGAVNQVSGVITNVGNLRFNPFATAGIGIYNLTGGAIYIGLGGITSDGGAYQVNLGGGTVSAVASWSSSLNMSLTGTGGPVTYNPNGNTITLSGALSGSGGLTVNGSGVLDLTGANTYTGDTLVTAGSTLQFDTTGTSFGAIKLANGSTLNLNYSGTRIAAAAYTNGVALSVGTYNAGNLPGFITGSGNLQVSSGISTGIWDGGGANNNWSTGGNWDQDSVPGFPIGVTFAGSTRLTNTNDLSSITAANITFSNTAGAFVLNGNDITLSGNIGFNGNPAAPIIQTVNLNMAWNANVSIETPTNGNLTLGGNISASANSLTKIDAGTLTLGGVDSFASYILNGGTNIITGTVTDNGTGSSRIALGNASSAFNGRLIIQPGAVFNVTGNFVDAFVIGRDGGSGTVIQNGGTFTFNPNNNGYIFVGASSNPGTQAEYDMNGGLLDMSGNTLSPGLADGGTTLTGLVKQVGGVINNVGRLWMSPVQAGGLGIYTLSGGSIYIGLGGITTASGNYKINLGGGTVGANTSWSSLLNMNLTNLNGSVTFDTAGNTITLSGVLSGNGGLTVTNSGILDLSGANTYSGDTIVTAGSTLQLDTVSSGLGAFRVVNGALLNLNYGGTITVPACYTNGVALASGVYTSANLPAFITGAGSLTVSTATPPIVNPPVISGGNLILTGSGGTAGAGYTWLSSTNLTIPIASWIINTTGTFDDSGNFSNAIPVSTSTPAQFFRLRTP